MRFLFNCGRLVNALIVLELLARSVVSYKFSYKFSVAAMPSRFDKGLFKKRKLTLTVSILDEERKLS